MKIEKIFIQSLQRELTFYIGKNAQDNFDVISMGEKNDLWFHSKYESSCHVVVKLSEYNLNKDDMRQIIKIGGMLCKQNTKKLNICKNVEIIYTNVKNITKTKVIGCVVTKETKTVIC